MRLLIPTVTICALLAFSVSARADGAQPTIGQPAAPQATAVKLICRPIFHEGMLLKGNDCRTQKEWDRLRRDEERGISDFQNRSYSG
jgi:hypothetical protein